MAIISNIKKWPVSVAFATGLATGTIGTVEVTQDKYAEDAEIITCSDTLVAAHKDTAFVFDTVKQEQVIERIVDVPQKVHRDAVRVRFVPKKGDVIRAPVFLNNEICGEIMYTIKENPLPPNDGLAGLVKLHIRPDRIAAVPEKEIGEVEK